MSWNFETPSEAIGAVVLDQVILHDRTFKIRRPKDPDLLLDHPAIHAAHARDDYMPYWADLWPSARMLAKAILREEWPSGLDALEVGCGLGVPGIAALAKGMRVTFSDYDAAALRFAAENARLNGFSQFELLPIDWRDPPPRQWSVVLGSDLIYEERNVNPLVKFLASILAPGGVCLLTDQDRHPAERFRESLEAAGFTASTRVTHTGQPNGLRIRGTLYRIVRSEDDIQPFL